MSRPVERGGAVSDLAVLDSPPDVSASPAADGLECPECAKTFAGAMAAARLGRHRRFAHGVQAIGRPKAKPKAKGPAAKAPSSPKPRPAATGAPAKARKSVAGLLGPVWSFLGSTMVPGKAGAIMAWEGPAAGPVLDKAIAGSFVDKLVLQRLAGNADRWHDVGSLMVLPVVALAIERQPELAHNPMLRGVAEDAIIRMLDTQLDAEIADKRQVEKLEAKARSAGYEGVAEKVSLMMALLFGPEVPAQTAA